MPQSKEVKNEQTRLRMKRMRNKGVTSDSVTDPSVTSSNHTEDPTATSKDNPHTETVPASYVQGITGKFKSLPKRPRYLDLSDPDYAKLQEGVSIVLGRLNQPEAHASDDFIQRMKACNESAYNFKPNEPDKERVKELTKGI